MRQREKGRLCLAVGILAISVGGSLFLLAGLRRGTASAAAASLLYSVASGMLASVSPCGVMMLPTYMVFHLGREVDGYSKVSRALRALLIAAVTLLGIIAVFLVAGGIVGAGSQWLIRASPYTGLFLGAAMVGLGIWFLVTRRTLGFLEARRMVINPQRNLINVFLFGIAYALGSLSCSLPLFLGVAGSALTSGGMLRSLAQFVGYALGMGSIIFVVAVGSALFGWRADRVLQAVARRAYRLSAVFLIVIGAYSIIYRAAVLLLATSGTG